MCSRHTTFIKSLHALKHHHILLINHLNCFKLYSIYLFNPQQTSNTTITMSGTSNVGNSQVYEAGDQRTVPDAEIEQLKRENRFHEGKENSHKALDSSKSFS